MCKAIEKEILDRILNELSNLEADIIAYAIVGRHGNVDQMVNRLKRTLKTHKQCLFEILDSEAI